jgi:plastocyanin
MSALVLAVLAAFVAVGLVDCSSSSTGSVASSTGASTTGATTPTGGPAVSIKNFSFSPVPLNVGAAETITITNNDSTDHTFTDDGGAFDTGHIAPGTSKTVTITKVGTYNYHCNIHPSMKGVIQADA